MRIFFRHALLKPHIGHIGLTLAFVIAAAGCASQTPAGSARGPFRSSSRSTGGYCVVPGDTVYHIAHRYGVSVEGLMAANRITDPRSLRVGRVLIIPRAHFRNASLPPATASVFGLPDPWSVPHADRHLAWPVAAGRVSSPFGMRNGAMHDGVDIAAPAGTPVLAADNGTVIFAGHLHGYGNVVIIRHSDGYVTVYAHNRRNFVGKGDSVARNQEIAEIGSSGRTTGPNLHFEVRYHNQAENPLAYLPEPGPSTGITFARNGGS
jgi:lipoprotein NlpD